MVSLVDIVLEAPARCDKYQTLALSLEILCVWKLHKMAPNWLPWLKVTLVETVESMMSWLWWNMAVGARH